jgi:hypothetical protein
MKSTTLLFTFIYTLIYNLIWLDKEPRGRWTSALDTRKYLRTCSFKNRLQQWMTWLSDLIINQAFVPFHFLQYPNALLVSDIHSYSVNGYRATCLVLHQIRKYILQRPFQNDDWTEGLPTLLEGYHTTKINSRHVTGFGGSGGGGGPSTSTNTFGVTCELKMHHNM